MKLLILAAAVFSSLAPIHAADYSPGFASIKGQDLTGRSLELLSKRCLAGTCCKKEVSSSGEKTCGKLT